MPMHFFSILQTLKLFLEIISAGRVFLVHIGIKEMLTAGSWAHENKWPYIVTEQDVLHQNPDVFKLKCVKSSLATPNGNSAEVALTGWAALKKKKCGCTGLVCLQVWEHARWIPPTPHHVVTCTHRYTHTHMHHFCRTPPHLRSRTPFSCVALPSVTCLPSNTRASFKLTSQESSDSSPDGRQDRGRIHSLVRTKKVSFPKRRHLSSVSHLSQRRKTPPRCSYWAEKVTMRYSEVMSPPSACPRSPASLQASQAAKHTTCNSTDGLNTEQGRLAAVVKARTLSSTCYEYKKQQLFSRRSLSVRSSVPQRAAAIS